MLWVPRPLVDQKYVDLTFHELLLRFSSPQLPQNAALLVKPMRVPAPVKTDSGELSTGSDPTPPKPMKVNVFREYSDSTSQLLVTTPLKCAVLKSLPC